MFMVMAEHATVRLTDVDFIVFGQQWSKEEKANRLNSLLFLVFPWDLLTLKKNTEYHQT